MVRKFMEKYSDIGQDLSPDEREQKLESFKTVIEAEVRRFLKTNRITQTNLLELDAKIALEAYLKEKKDAILQDRKDEATGEK